MESSVLWRLFDRTGAALIVADGGGTVVRANRRFRELVGSPATLAGLALAALTDADGRVVFDGLEQRDRVGPLDRRFEPGDGRQCEVVAFGERVVDDTLSRPLIFGQLFDVTKRRQAEGVASRRLEQLQALVELGRVSLSITEESEDAVFDHATRLLQAHLPVERTVVIQVGQGERAVIRSAQGVGVPDGRLEVPRSELIEYFAASAAGIITDDIDRDPRFGPDPRLAAGGIHSVIGAPVSVAGRPWGMVAGGSRAVGTFCTEDLPFVEGVAEVLGGNITRRWYDLATREALEHGRAGAITTLAAGFAHDIGNALAVVKSQAQVLQVADLPPARVAGSGEVIARAADHIVELVERMLHGARGPIVEPRPIHLADAVDAIAPVLRRLTPPGLQLRTEHPTEPCSAMATRLAVEEILLNLTLNAIDATPAGGRIVIRTSCEVGHVLLSVADTGVGMTPEVRARAFEPLFSTKPDGSGLGLAQVRALVTELSGDVSLSSRPNEGTDVVVRLPRAGADA